MSMHIPPLWAVVLIWSVGACSTSGGEFYVAPNGNDANPGTKQQPFASLTRARDAVRQFKRANSTEDIVVLLRGGVYRLTETVVFTLEDSGSPNQTIAYAAYPGETPILSAGVPIARWKKLSSYPQELSQSARGNVWVADVSFVRELKERQTASSTVATQMDCGWRFFTLYEKGRRLQRARGKRFLLLRRPQKLAADRRIFAFPKGAVRSWPDLAESELLLIPNRIWISNILPIVYADEAAGIARTSVPSTYSLTQPYGIMSDRPTTWVENVLALLDEPDEWVLDSQAERLYLWPSSEKPSDQIVVPLLTELIRIEGKINYEGAHDTPVTHLTFRGLTFTHGDRFPWHGKTGWGLQHDWERFDSPSALVRLRGTEKCVVEGCHFTTSGCTGLRLDLHCRKNRVVGNHFEYLGGVGILLAGYGPGTKDVNRQNEVANNLIHYIGELYWGSPAIFVWQSSENRIAHNHIHDTPYAGICVTGRIMWDPQGVGECSRTIRWRDVGGIEANRALVTTDIVKSPTWRQREKCLHARRNIVERNNIHDVMQVTGDGNCIYISGAGTGNHILENYCHDCPSRNMHAVIRCDGDQHGTTIERNILHRCGGNSTGFISKGDNDIIENIVADLRDETSHRGYLVFPFGRLAGSTIQRNVFYSRKKGQLVCSEGDARNEFPPALLRKTDADYNLYFCTEDPDWGALHFQKERPNGIEKHSVSADPLFNDVDNGDFRFRSGSPALKLGIKQPISIDEVGPQSPYRERWKYK